jgi:hypothetical protein
MGNPFHYWTAILKKLNHDFLIKLWKHFLSTILALIVVNTIHSQTRGTKVGYIDMEYIHRMYPIMPKQLSSWSKKHKWKQEIETKKSNNKIRALLKTLLTKDWLRKKLEIKFLKNVWIFSKKFGFMEIWWCKNLFWLIQDQVFTAVQDIAESLNTTFFLTSLLINAVCCKRFDISDQVLQYWTEQKRNSWQKNNLKLKQNKEDAIEDNPFLAERQKILDDKKSHKRFNYCRSKVSSRTKKADFEEKRQKCFW